MLVAVVTLAAGVILLVWPKATLIVVAALLGAALLVTGIFRLISRVHRARRQRRHAGPPT